MHFCLPDIEKNITSPPRVSAATINPSINLTFLVRVAAARSSRYLQIKKYILHETRTIGSRHVYTRTKNKL